MIKKRNINIPKLFSDKEECCGCGACFSICKQKAISMLEDNEGFVYPIISEKLCICCNMCLKICQFKN